MPNRYKIYNIVKEAANADFDNEYYYAVYSTSGTSATINGVSTTLPAGIILRRNITSISATADVYIIGDYTYSVDAPDTLSNYPEPLPPGPVVIPSTDVDVTAFMEAAGIVDDTIETALDTFITTLKTDSIWDSTIALYPFVTDKTDSVDIQGQFKYNLKDPQDTDAAYRLTTIGSVTFNTTGIVTGAGGGRLQTHTSSAGVGFAQMWHRGSFAFLQGYWNSTAQIIHAGQYNIVGGGELGTHIYGRVDDNTMILCGPLAHQTGVSDAIYGGDYVVASIGGVSTPGAYQFFGGYYLRTNSDLDWQVIDGDFMGRSGFSPAFSTNEISLYILTNPISKEQTLSLQTAINQLQTDLGRATH